LLTLEKLRSLLAVANHGTIAGAAVEVGYTPSAVSQQLSTLERELGISLVERSNRGVSLTPAGRQLCVRAPAILDLVQIATVEATEAGQGTAPITLRIGAFPTAISALVVPAMALLEPLVRLKIVHLEPEQALTELAARRLDAAVVDFYDALPEQSPAGLHHVNLLTDPLRIAVRVDRAASLDLEDLAGIPWVLANPESRFGRGSRIALEAVGLRPTVLAEIGDHWLTFDVMRTLNVATVLPGMALRGAPEHVLPVQHIHLDYDRHVHFVTREVLRPHPGFRMLEGALREIAER
jgi:DNA-binding transcriptional LysR family regulator